MFFPLTTWFTLDVLIHENGSCLIYHWWYTCSVPNFDAKSMFNPNQCWPYLFKSPRLMRFWFGSIFKVNQDSSEVRTLQPLCCPCAAHTKSCGPVARLEVTIIFIAFQTGVACTRCVCIGPLNCGTVAWSFALSWQKRSQIASLQNDKRAIHWRCSSHYERCLAYPRFWTSTLNFHFWTHDGYYHTVKHFDKK